MPGGETAPTLTRDDFIEFLRSKNAERDCDACGHSSWSTIVETENGGAVGIAIFNAEDSSIITRGVVTACVVCDNCSNTRFFWRSVILKWKQGRETAQNG